MIKLHSGCMTISLCLCLWSGVSVCAASSASPAEKQYTMTQSQLNQWQSNLTRLSAINSQLQKDWSNQQSKLLALEQQCMSLEYSLNQQRRDSEKQLQSLQTVKESAQRSERNLKAQIHKEKVQKIIWMVIGGVAGGCGLVNLIN